MSKRNLLLTLAMAALVACAKPSSLTAVNAEVAGDNCAAGGFALTRGLDSNGDGELNSDEVSSTEYLCHGTVGSDGEPSPANLTLVSDEPAGDNCAAGGRKLTSGTDANGDGAITGEEVLSVEYICNSETPTLGTMIMSSNYIGYPDTVCPGGYVRNALGIDANGDALLSTDEESHTFLSCNQLPVIAGAGAIDVADCQAVTQVSAEANDIDGSIASYVWIVSFSPSDLVLSGQDTATVSIAAGEHSAGATLLLTVTDNYGAETSRAFSLIFGGNGCLPLDHFYGVDPSTCIGVEFAALAGDDRGGPVVTSDSVFYNGDEALIRMDLDLTNVTRVHTENVDSLFADRSSGTLYSFWSSDFAEDATVANGSELGFRDVVWDRIVELDSQTLAPVRSFDLAFPLNARDHDYEDPEMGLRNGLVSSVLVAATDGHVLVMTQERSRPQAGGGGSDSIRTRLINLATGELVLERSLSGEDVYHDWSWSTQEVSVGGYSLYGNAEEGFRAVFRNFRTWREYNINDNSLMTLSETFARNCDARNLAVDASSMSVYIHAEEGCFGPAMGGVEPYPNEVIYRCVALMVSNADGAIDDSGDGD